MTTLCFADIETDSLRPDAQIWEVGIIARRYLSGEDLVQLAQQWDPGGGIEAYTTTEHRWLLPIGDLTRSDPMALAIGRYHGRHPDGNDYDPALNAKATEPDMAAQSIARITHGAHLVGISIDFDAQRLERFLLANGQAPSWNYRLCDCRTLAAGRLGVPLTADWETERLASKLGVDEPTDSERHTALGDAAWAQRIYDAVMAFDEDDR